jgi:hypothetical protein
MSDTAINDLAQALQTPATPVAAPPKGGPCSQCYWFKRKENTNYGNCQLNPATFIGGPMADPKFDYNWAQPIMPIDGTCQDFT